MADNALLGYGRGPANVLADLYDPQRNSLNALLPQRGGGNALAGPSMTMPSAGFVEGERSMVGGGFQPGGTNAGITADALNVLNFMGTTHGPPAIKRLPMDYASRMERANALGYDTSRVFYHGTGRDFPEFSLAAAGTGGNAGLKERGMFFSSVPAVSDSYLGGVYIDRASASAIADGSMDLGNGVGRWYSPGAQVLPVHLRNLEDYAAWDLGGAGYKPSAMADFIREARRDGAPGLLLENVRDPGLMNATGPLGSSRAPSTTAITFRPNGIRSVFANFDPKKAKSGNILAGSAGALAVGTAAGDE